MKPKKLSIITANFNSGELLFKTFESISNILIQCDVNWVIIDNNSHDTSIQRIIGTEKYRKCANNIRIIIKSDFGIYNAINNGIVDSKSEYYIVLGAGDTLFEERFINSYDQIINSDFDIGVFKVLRNSKVIGPLITDRKLSFLSFLTYTLFYSSHSVGTVIKSELHNKIGYYSKFYPIMADSFFLTQALYMNDLKFKYFDKIIGEFDNGGVTSTNMSSSAIEYFSIQCKLNKSLSVQFLLLFVRLARLKFKSVLKI